MSVDLDGDVLSKIEAGKKGGKGNILEIKWIIDDSYLVCSMNSCYASVASTNATIRIIFFKTFYGIIHIFLQGITYSNDS